MNLLLNINSKDAPLIIKLLKSTKSQIKITPVNTKKVQFIKDLEAAMQEAKDIESGKSEGISAEKAIHDLRRSLDTKVS